MSLSLGAIGRMSGENDDTTSQTSLGACHPDESNKHMKHFEITERMDQDVNQITISVLYFLEE